MHLFRRRLRVWLTRRITMAVANLLVVGSVLLLFGLRLLSLPMTVQIYLEWIDSIVPALPALEFLLRFFAFGTAYFLRDFGWVDLLSVLPILAPLVSMVGQFRALRIARLIRLVRIIRVVRLVRALDEGTAEHLQMKARFFLAVSSTAMLFLPATAIGITALVDHALRAVTAVDAELLLDRIELVIMSSAVLAAVGITATANRYGQPLPDNACYPSGLGGKRLSRFGHAWREQAALAPRRSRRRDHGASEEGRSRYQRLYFIAANRLCSEG